ncbi:MAG: molybdenum cofactor guanylyltransferase [Deltaproteobacteria bacterium]|nr:molybdenum cofactor guanylyltransferase [Deltaproteobacteria bacterium]
MTGIILAGGKSSRMGFNKAFIDIGGQHIIKRTINLFKELFDEIILVVNNPADYEQLDIPTVTDIFKGAGSLGGIYTGLFHASSEHSFIAACDMPFLNKEVISRMIQVADGSSITVPFIMGRYHPLHAVYSHTCLKPIAEMIKNQDLRITNLFQKVKVKKLDEKNWLFSEQISSSLDNINTREDLNRAIQSLSHLAPLQSAKCEF